MNCCKALRNESYLTDNFLKKFLVDMTDKSIVTDEFNFYFIIANSFSPVCSTRISTVMLHWFNFFFFAVQLCFFFKVWWRRIDDRNQIKIKGVMICRTNRRGFQEPTRRPSCWIYWVKLFTIVNNDYMSSRCKRGVILSKARVPTRSTRRGEAWRSEALDRTSSPRHPINRFTKTWTICYLSLAPDP